MAAVLSLALAINGYQSWKAHTLFVDTWSVLKVIAAFILVPIAALIVLGALSALPTGIQIFIWDGFLWLLIIGLIYLIWFIIKNWTEMRSGKGDDYSDDLM